MIYPNAIVTRKEVNYKTFIFCIVDTTDGITTYLRDDLVEDPDRFNWDERLIVYAYPTKLSKFENRVFVETQTLRDNETGEYHTFKIYYVAHRA